MSDFKTGTYIIKANKIWICNCCNNEIKTGESAFARVKEYGDEMTRSDGKKYKLKDYTRFHINCAKKLRDLNEYEKGLLNITKIEEDRMKFAIDSVYGVKSVKNSSLDDILEMLEKIGFKAIYMDSDSIFLKKRV